MDKKLTNSQKTYLKSLHEKAFGHTVYELDDLTLQEASKEIKRLEKLIKKKVKLDGKW